MEYYRFDLDHTLCNVRKVGDHWDYRNAVPDMERIAKVNKLYDEGNHITIDTARGYVSGINWLPFTSEQVIGWGIKFHRLRTGIKIPCTYDIDDKAVHPDEFFKTKLIEFTN